VGERRGGGGSDDAGEGAAARPGSMDSIFFYDRPGRELVVKF
jgi:hypothetical protein